MRTSKEIFVPFRLLIISNKIKGHVSRRALVTILCKGFWEFLLLYLDYNSSSPTVVFSFLQLIFLAGCSTKCKKEILFFSKLGNECIKINFNMSLLRLIFVKIKLFIRGKETRNLIIILLCRQLSNQYYFIFFINC